MNKFKMSSDLQRVIKSLVKPQYCGSTLLTYLSDRFNYNTPAEWQEIIGDGRIKVNGVNGKPEQVLHELDALEYYHIDHPEPQVDFNYSVIAKTDSFMVVNKPGNLPVHPAGPFFHHTLWAALKKEGLEPRFINRLDRETSGLIIVALNKEAASRLGKQIQSKSVYKEYQVIVEGCFKGRLDAKGYLQKDSDSEIEKKLLFHADEDFAQYGKNGVDSSFELIENQGKLSLLRCIIRTGKMHQIRATLKSLGFPLVGDKIYGLDENFYLKFIHKQLEKADYQKMRLKRQALHAHVLRFKDPETAKDLEFICELPEDMKKVLKEQ